ncbi:hypothetical protein ACP5WJ_20995 [Bacteroides thetaiotaomicron]
MTVSTNKNTLLNLIVTTDGYKLNDKVSITKTIGECKWTNKEDAQRLVNSLEAKIKYLPFIKKGQSVHIMLFLKNEPHNKDAARIIYPSDIVKTE